MSDEKLQSGIFFNNIRVDSIEFNSGIFAGFNRQQLWRSENTSLFGFGNIRGEDNLLTKPYGMVTDSGSSSELLEYYEELVAAKMGKRGK